MGKCKKIVRTINEVCIGSLNRRISLLTRTLTPPTGGSVDFDEELTLSTSVWAMVQTPTGANIFDEVNIDRKVTHKISIRFIQGLTAETWIKLPSVTGGATVLLDILDIINLEENNRFMLLKCSLRGDDTKAANLA